MAKSKRKRIEHLIKVLYIQSKSKKQELMVEFLKEEIERLSDGTIEFYEDNGNIYITKGQAKSYPCVVAHMDTVHNICDNFKIYEHGDSLFSMDTSDYSRAGIGGDDKVGIFCALEALETLSSVKIAFFRDEEIGCIGSGLADMDFFSDCSFVLQADRKGYNDFVRVIHGTTLFNDAFSDAIAPSLKKHRKTECLTGGSTDVNTLFRKGIGICVANCSCGYYNPHRDGEYVVISEVLATSNLFLDIIKSVHVDGKRWEMPKYEIPRPQSTNYNYSNNRHGQGATAHHGAVGRRYPTLPKLADAFHFLDDLPKPDVIEHDISCPHCETDISDLYDPYEDGYYCVICNEYGYLPITKWSVNDDDPEIDIVARMMADKRRKRRAKRNNNKK